MWRGSFGPCTCFFCTEGKPHPESHAKFGTHDAGHLQVAESLDPNDIVRTTICNICTHEVRK